MNPHLSFFLKRVIKYINTLCVVYLLFFFVFSFVYVLKRNIDYANFSFKKVILTIGIPIVIFFITMYINKRLK